MSLKTGCACIGSSNLERLKLAYLRAQYFYDSYHISVILEVESWICNNLWMTTFSYHLTFSGSSHLKRDFHLHQWYLSYNFLSNISPRIIQGTKTLVSFGTFFADNEFEVKSWSQIASQSRLPLQKKSWLAQSISYGIIGTELIISKIGPHRCWWRMLKLKCVDERKLNQHNCVKNIKSRNI